MPDPYPHGSKDGKTDVIDEGWQFLNDLLIGSEIFFSGKLVAQGDRGGVRFKPRSRSSYGKPSFFFGRWKVFGTNQAGGRHMMSNELNRVGGVDRCFLFLWAQPPCCNSTFLDTPPTSDITLYPFIVPDPDYIILFARLFPSSHVATQ